MSWNSAAMPPTEKEFLLHAGKGKLSLLSQKLRCRFPKILTVLVNADSEKKHIDRMHVMIPLLVNQKRRVFLISAQDIQKVHKIIIAAQRMFIAVQKSLIYLSRRLLRSLRRKKPAMPPSYKFRSNGHFPGPPSSRENQKTGVPIFLNLKLSRRNRFLPSSETPDSPAPHPSQTPRSDSRRSHFP